MDQLFKEYVLIALSIGFNLGQLFGSAFKTTEDFFHQVRIHWPMPWRRPSTHMGSLLLLVLEGYLRAFALQEQIASYRQDLTIILTNQVCCLVTFVGPAATPISQTLSMLYTHWALTTFNSRIKRAARAIRVSVADRIKSQPIEAIKTVMGTTATAAGSCLKVELNKSKAANGAAHTANGLEWEKL